MKKVVPRVGGFTGVFGLMLVGLTRPADALSVGELCSPTTVADCPELKAACVQVKRCVDSNSGPTCPVVRGAVELRKCAACRSAVESTLAVKKACSAKPNADAGGPKPATSADSGAPVLPSNGSQAKAVGAPGVVPAIPALCLALPKTPDLSELIADSNYGYCTENIDCPCTYEPCSIGLGYAYANVVTPSVVDPENPGWSKTKVKNGTGKEEWMFCTIRRCQISATILKSDEKWLRCWSPPL
jgi:hypothetical protein